MSKPNYETEATALLEKWDIGVAESLEEAHDIAAALRRAHAAGLREAGNIVYHDTVNPNVVIAGRIRHRAEEMEK